MEKEMKFSVGDVVRGTGKIHNLYYPGATGVILEAKKERNGNFYLVEWTAEISEMKLSAKRIAQEKHGKNALYSIFTSKVAERVIEEII